MNYIYSVLLCLGHILVAVLAKMAFLMPNNKFKKFVLGQQGLLSHIRQEISSSVSSPTIWLHASSLGEYAVARPLVKQLKEKGFRIVVTFFSSTGYEAMRNNHPFVDHVFYLPLDTPYNVKQFLDIIRPQKAIFIISEYWINYLSELDRRHIPTFLVSAIIKDTSIFFKWYGGLYRRALKTYTRITVLNEASEKNLNTLGFNNVEVTGNPLFDNIITISEKPWKNRIIENFAKKGPVFIGGSISDDKDLEMVAFLANKHRNIPFILVPHEIDDETIRSVQAHLQCPSVLYTDCDETTDFMNVQTLIINCVGILADLYRYGTWAYVGGGFTPYLHSLIEASAYGLPVAFGPEIHRKVTPRDIIRLQIGQIVQTPEELDRWFCSLKDNQPEMARIQVTAQHYVLSNSGAAQAITQTIMNA